VAARRQSGRTLAARLKLRQLWLVVAIAQRRTLRQAAADLAMTQPAATKLLRDLEDAIGLPLFIRHAWGMTPTDYGAALVRHARGMLNELGQARAELDAMAAGAKGTLRIGCTTGAVPGLVVPAMRRMQAEHAGVRMSVLVNANEVLLAALREQTLDLAVCPLPADVQDLSVEPLGEEPLRIVARTGHPLTRRRGVPAATLAQVHWIVQPPDSPLRRDIDALLGEAGERLRGPTIETVSIVATLALLQASDAITAMPQALARHYGEHGMLAELDVKLATRISRYELVLRADRELSPAAEAFVAILRARERVKRSRR
jgi:DNA-binding transcriptional LysR family regulator